MAIIKTSPNELSIHGGGPPAFDNRLPAISAHVGDGVRFTELAGRMFTGDGGPGQLVDEFETAFAEWAGVRTVIGFSSIPAALRCLDKVLPSAGKVALSALGMDDLAFPNREVIIDNEPTTYGMCPSSLSASIDLGLSAVFAHHVAGRACRADELDDLCDEQGIPLFFLGSQALGGTRADQPIARFGQGSIFELGRGQLVHAMDSAVFATDDDLIAFRLRKVRREREDRIDPAMGDAAAAMGLANLESADRFIESNHRLYRFYQEHLGDVPGISLTPQGRDSTCQAITIEVDPGEAGIRRDTLYDVLTAENVGSIKIFSDHSTASGTVATRIGSRLLQLPSGPAVNEEAVQAICRLVELAIVRGMEAPDPIRLVA